MMDTTYCTSTSANAKLRKNSTSSEVIDSGRDLKNIDKMHPLAASLVQRYTRNGNYLFQHCLNHNLIHQICTNKKPISEFHCQLDAELPKPVKPMNHFPKSKISRIRTNSLRQNRNEQYNQSSLPLNDWDVKSGCHFSCIENSMGIQIISSKFDHSTNIQLCHAEFIVNYVFTF